MAAKKIKYRSLPANHETRETAEIEADGLPDVSKDDNKKLVLQIITETGMQERIFEDFAGGVFKMAFPLSETPLESFRIFTETRSDKTGEVKRELVARGE